VEAFKALLPDFRVEVLARLQALCENWRRSTDLTSWLAQNTLLEKHALTKNSRMYIPPILSRQFFVLIFVVRKALLSFGNFLQRLLHLTYFEVGLWKKNTPSDLPVLVLPLTFIKVECSMQMIDNLTEASVILILIIWVYLLNHFPLGYLFYSLHYRIRQGKTSICIDILQFRFCSFPISVINKSLLWVVLFYLLQYWHLLFNRKSHLVRIRCVITFLDKRV
jgi:hypothetical protein